MFQDKKVAFHTLGCKLNFSETSTISRQLVDIGFKKIENNQKPDLFVLNTCSVTENANKECERIIRKNKKESPNSFIIVTGCYAQLKPNRIANIEGVDMVVGADEKFNLPELLQNIDNKEKNKIHGCELKDLKYESSFSLNERTRSFLKIQDGCDYPCTYCTIPLARGGSRCDSVENILSNAKYIGSKGIKEIVLTGINIGLYKDKKTNQKLLDLLYHLEDIKEIERFRISSIEPNLITDKTIDFIAESKKFMPHFHIPMQSGSNEILGKMKRRYQKDLYYQKIMKITNTIEDVCIGADVIVGFPGESEDLFMQTYEFIKSIPLSYLHVFPYSERENTLALNMGNSVNKSMRNERSKKLRILSKKLEQQFYHKYLGQTRKVLIENEKKNETLFGFTDNYIKVKIPYNKKYSSTIQNVLLDSIDKYGVVNGKIII